MAWLETIKNGYFQIVFWIDDERYKRGLGTQDERLAHVQKLRLPAAAPITSDQLQTIIRKLRASELRVAY